MVEHDFRYNLLSPQHTLIECRSLAAGLYQVTGNGGSIQNGDVLARLLTFPNVIITAHQAFLTREALSAIASTTLDNIVAWRNGTPQNLIEG